MSTYLCNNINGYSQVCLCSGDNSVQLLLVLRANLLEGDDGSGLLVDDRSETRLALHNDVRDTHLAAEGGEEDDELDGVDIVGDDNERRLLGLDERNAVVETVLDEEGLLGVLHDKRVSDSSRPLTGDNCVP